MSLYLAVTKSRAELIAEGLGEVTHTKKGTRGCAPGIVSKEVQNRHRPKRAVQVDYSDDWGAVDVAEEDDMENQIEWQESQSLFFPPRRSPTSSERRKMVGMMLETAVTAVMKGHMYSFNNEVRLQKEGGPIGLRLSGVLAKLVMLLWGERV